MFDFYYINICRLRVFSLSPDVQVTEQILRTFMTVLLALKNEFEHLTTEKVFWFGIGYVVDSPTRLLSQPLSLIKRYNLVPKLKHVFYI